MSLEPEQVAESVVDCDEYGRPVSERYRRLGAKGLQEDGMYVRFEPGFGLNVHIGFRRRTERFGSYGTIYGPHEDADRLVLGIQGWERLCELVDVWRERERHSDGGDDA